MLIDYLFSEPLRRRSFATALFRLSQLLSEKSNGYYDVAIRALCKFFRSKISLQQPNRLTPLQIINIAKNVAADGFAIMPRILSNDELSELESFITTVPAFSNTGEQIMVNLNDLPTSYPRLTWKMNDLIQLDVIKNLSADSFMPYIAQEYLGSRVILSHIILWLDPVYSEKYDAHVYHFDNDGPGFLKFFYYVNNISELNGPHRFIRGTHIPVKPLRFRKSNRYNDNDLFDFYGKENEIVFSGTAGTGIAEDTHGFHRGTTVHQGYRIILQFEYSIIDIPTDEEFVTPITPIKNPSLGKQMSSIVKKFYKQ